MPSLIAIRSHAVRVHQNKSVLAPGIGAVVLGRAGMQFSAQVSNGPFQGGVFLTFWVHDHDIALFPASSAATQGKEFEHIGLEVDCDGNIDRLRRLCGSLIRNNVRIKEILDHGTSIGVYFLDPDGHMLEVFCQLIAPNGGAAIAELGRNEGQAIPTQLEPLFE